MGRPEKNHLGESGGYGIIRIGAITAFRQTISGIVGDGAVIPGCDSRTGIVIRGIPGDRATSKGVYTGPAIRLRHIALHRTSRHCPYTVSIIPGNMVPLDQRPISGKNTITACEHY